MDSTVYNPRNLRLERQRVLNLSRCPEQLQKIADFGINIVDSPASLLRPVLKSQREQHGLIPYGFHLTYKTGGFEKVAIDLVTDVESIIQGKSRLQGGIN